MQLAFMGAWVEPGHRLGLSRHRLGLSPGLRSV